MIYQVKYPINPDIHDQFARFRVDGDGIITSVYMEGDWMVAIIPVFLNQMTTARVSKLNWQDVKFQLLEAHWSVDVSEEKKPMPINEKMALFCRLYEQFKGVKYKATGADVGKLKAMSINEELLMWYLNDKVIPETSATWLFRGKQSVGNLAKYQNEVRACMAKPAQGRFPNTWSAQFERNLSGPDITEFRKHLAGLGLVPKRARDGSILDYVKPNGANA